MDTPKTVTTTRAPAVLITTREEGGSAQSWPSLTNHDDRWRKVWSKVNVLIKHGLCVLLFWLLWHAFEKHPKSTTSSISRFGVVWFGVLVWRQQPEMTEGPLPNLPRPQTLQRNKQVIKSTLKWKCSYICEIYYSSDEKYSSLRSDGKGILPFFYQQSFTLFWSKACLSRKRFTKNRKLGQLSRVVRTPSFPSPPHVELFLLLIFFLLKMNAS